MFCTTLRQRPAFMGIISSLQSPRGLSLKESHLSTHDLSITISRGEQNSPNGIAIAPTMIYFLLLSATDLDLERVESTGQRIQHFGKLTGGANVAIVFVLAEPTKMIAASCAIQSNVHTYAALQCVLSSDTDLPMIPILTCTTASTLVSTIKTYVAKITQMETSSNPSCLSAIPTVMDMVKECTVNAPMSDFHANVVSDIFDSFGHLAEACCNAKRYRDARCRTDDIDVADMLDGEEEALLEQLEIVGQQVGDEAMVAMIDFWAASQWPLSNISAGTTITGQVSAEAIGDGTMTWLPFLLALSPILLAIYLGLPPDIRPSSLQDIALLLPSMQRQVPSNDIAHSTFDVRGATISSIHAALLSGQTTCHAIVASHLARIHSLNPAINAIISLAPDSLSIASTLDARLSKSTPNPLPPLFGIPILLKDNFDLSGLPTTSGSKRLADSRPKHDAPTVAALKAAGAIILGKTNLHELALEGLTVSSLGGQTLNPYDLSRTSGGSSGGTGAAVAAGLAVLGTGSDTVNSLRSPASANCLVSVRPTWGLVSRRGVVPNSWTQDVVGPMGRCVEDVAIMLQVMKGVGFDGGDTATAVVPREVWGVDYTGGLKGGSLRGLRLGVLEKMFDRTSGEETDPVNEAMDGVLAALRKAGVTIVPVADEVYEANELLRTVDTQRYEFRQQVDAYLGSPDLAGEHAASLREIFEDQSDFLVIPAQYEYVKTALVSGTGDEAVGSKPSYAAVKQKIANLRLKLQRTFAEDRLDGIIYPQQKRLVVKVGSPSQVGRNGILAAVTGFPVVALPAGFSPKSVEAPLGVPIGFELLGLPFSEDRLLQIAYQMEQLLKVRMMPVMAEEIVEAEDMETVPTVIPNTKDIPLAYPLGRLASD